MNSQSSRKIDKSESIRHKLFEEDLSPWKRYAILVIGEPSFLKLLKYEAITFLFGQLPGALGIALRKMFYPTLFRKVGKGVVFGRSLIIRNAQKISIGSGVIIDDYSLVDGRGSGEVGVNIGDSVIINREVILISKVGPISIGAGSDIGARSMVISTGGIRIGERVSLAGRCNIGGSVAHVQGNADVDARGSKTSKGEVQIGDNCILYMSVVVLDGVDIGKHSVVGSGVHVQNDIPNDTIVAVHQKLVYLNRSAVSASTIDEVQRPAVDSETASTLMHNSVESAGAMQDVVAVAVFAALEELNMLRSKPDRIEVAMATSLIELDSMDKVNLIVETEQKLADQLSRPVVLDGQTLFSHNETVFSTVAAFVDEIANFVAR